ncbi:ferredoxin-2, mitochondrial [Nematocida sp. LUAm3]|nr:ferredoxin-2, mitochondrial [Nematocida sp. LUAm3]KAI5173912.1 ferredoxin-2, mitochondrial [Nematocida sp. LUAm2]KAI5177343.1 ferredoxin-2, mitochondrial [Nematocida sp. LUAm1]
MSLIKILYEAKGEVIPVLVEKGISLVEAAHRNKIALPSACEESLACTTCHVVLDRNTYENTKNTLSMREEDLLDRAKGLTSRSRLACQLRTSSLFNMAHVKIPGISRNIGDELQKKK